MKAIKLLVLLALSLLLIFTMVACGGNTDTDTDSTAENDTQIDSEIKDTSVNSDTVSDILSDTDSDITTDTNTNTDTDSDITTDTDTDTDSDITTDTDTDTDSDITNDTNTDTGSDIPDDGADDVTEPWKSNASAEVISQAEALLASKHRLEYNEDGSFRVMIIADAHMDVGGNATDVQEVKDRVKMMVDKIQPNLVILTGDNTIHSSSESKLRQNISAIVSYVEEKQIPWCHVYGNHDHEGALANSVQQGIYESFEYCISKDVENLSGTGTYVHGVYNKDGSLGSLIWLIDSGAYVDKSKYPGNYDFIKQDQIDWYKETSLLIKEYNNGRSVKGMMAFHIPLIENRDAQKNVNNPEIVLDASGGVNESMCPSEVDTNLLETIFELGNIKAIVTGHDHVNDYMFNYKGVKLTSSPNLSDLTYYNVVFQGSRAFDLNTSTLDNIPTYVEYVLERVNSDDFEDLGKNVVLEDFEGEFADPVISGWASNSMAGTATITAVDKKGTGGSVGLEIIRDNTGNFEFVIDISSAGKVGNNKYVIFWMDLTQIDFRKACIGLTSTEGYENPFRTDDLDGASPKFYYLADGTKEWKELAHGTDGCFGREQEGSVNGLKGYFAFPISDLRQGNNKMNENTVITGLYFYASLWYGEAYLNKPFYIDNVMLVENYQVVSLPTE